MEIVMFKKVLMILTVSFLVGNVNAEVPYTLHTEEPRCKYIEVAFNNHTDFKGIINEEDVVKIFKLMQKNKISIKYDEALVYWLGVFNGMANGLRDDQLPEDLIYGSGYIAIQSCEWSVKY